MESMSILLVAPDKLDVVSHIPLAFFTDAVAFWHARHGTCTKPCPVAIRDWEVLLQYPWRSCRLPTGHTVHMMPCRTQHRSHGFTCQGACRRFDTQMSEACMLLSSLRPPSLSIRCAWICSHWTQAGAHPCFLCILPDDCGS